MGDDEALVVDKLILQGKERREEERREDRKDKDKAIAEKQREERDQSSHSNECFQEF